jgi:hypothetical protein
MSMKRVIHRDIHLPKKEKDRRMNDVKKMRFPSDVQIWLYDFFSIINFLLI